MKEVYKTNQENKSKIDELLKKDDIVSRGSIIIKDGQSLGMEGLFFIIDNTEEGIKKAEELVNDLWEKAENKEEILKKIQEEEDSATQGFGNIFGD